MICAIDVIGNARILKFAENFIAAKSARCEHYAFFGFERLFCTAGVFKIVAVKIRIKFILLADHDARYATFVHYEIVKFCAAAKLAALIF